MEDMKFAYQVPTADELRKQSIESLSLEDDKDFKQLLEGMRDISAKGKFIYKGLVRTSFAGSDAHHLLKALNYQVAIAPFDQYKNTIVVSWHTADTLLGGTP